jgi:hypothetical protein
MMYLNILGYIFLYFVIQHWSCFHLLWSYGDFNMCAGKNKRENYSDEFIATFYEIHLITVQNVHHSFHCTALLVLSKSLLPVESFWSVLICKQ